ncbi:hypothetical protein [Sphingopyxis sp. PET50]|uniref:hypothetical protein n=1 Tax=Sphingopyxis sp. PET50 TaxID=2976533 RepID=UPI0021AFEF20|nr:hypothetical protein [Sphingopyxis sp. PET50]
MKTGGSCAIGGKGDCVTVTGGFCVGCRCWGSGSAGGSGTVGNGIVLTTVGSSLSLITPIIGDSATATTSAVGRPTASTAASGRCPAPGS